MTDKDLSTEITMSEYDVREQAHRHDLERRQTDGKWRTEQAKYSNREARQETVRWVGISLVVVLLILGIATIIWRANAGPDDDAAREQQREETCVANGGGWVPQDLLATSSSGICVYPGERASE